MMILIAPFITYSYSRQETGLLHASALKYRLDNGLTVILKQDHRTPTFSAVLYVRTGSATEGEYSGSGITHLIEHMIFKGTSTRDAQQFEKEVKALGVDTNAYTTFDYTAFTMQGPRDNIAPLLGIFYDIISDPQFDEKELNKEKDVVRREMQMIQDNPQKYLSRQLWQTAYITHPYRNPVIGYEGIFDNLLSKDLKAYYGRFYIPDNMVLVMVGDINIRKIKEEIAETFGKLPRRNFTDLPVFKEPSQLAPRKAEISYATSKSSMLLGFHSVSLSDRDLYALDTLAIILGEGNSSLLYQDLHNRQNLVYGINAYNYTPFQAGMFIIGATFEPGKEEKVLAGIFKIIESIKKSSPKKKELDKAKNQVISSYIFSKQTQESQASDLGTSQLLTGDMDFSTCYVEGIGSVTSNDISYVAGKYLNKENMTNVLLVPHDIKRMDKKARAAPEARRSVTKKILRNGIRVLITEDKTLPLVSVRVCFKGGLRTENEQNNGISNLTARMLLKGTGGRSEEELFSMVESIGGTISAYSGNNSFGISLDIMSKDIKKGIEIIADILSRPAFPKDKLRILKRDVLAQIDLMDYDIFISTRQSLKEKLFARSPYAMNLVGSHKSIEKISRRDIINYYRKYCVGPNAVVSICGDINGGKMFRLANAKLKGLKRRRFPQVKKIKLLSLGNRVDIKKNMDKQQAVVMAGFRSAGVANSDRYPLQILSSIYSGSSGRLYKNIRHKEGMAYTLGTFGMTGIGTGSFIFYAATTLKNIGYVTDEIFAQIDAANKGSITEEEIDSAKKSLIAQYQIGLQSAGAFAFKIALDELYGLGYNHYLLYPETIGKISRETVTQISNKYFTPKSCVVSTTVPEEKEQAYKSTSDKN
jgi:zinc protease